MSDNSARGLSVVRRPSSSTGEQSFAAICRRSDDAAGRSPGTMLGHFGRGCGTPVPDALCSEDYGEAGHIKNIRRCTALGVAALDHTSTLGKTVGKTVPRARRRLLISARASLSRNFWNDIDHARLSRRNAGIDCAARSMSEATVVLAND